MKFYIFFYFFIQTFFSAKFFIKKFPKDGIELFFIENKDKNYRKFGSSVSFFKEDKKDFQRFLNLFRCSKIKDFFKIIKIGENKIKINFDFEGIDQLHIIYEKKIIGGNTVETPIIGISQRGSERCFSYANHVNERFRRLIKEKDRKFWERVKKLRENKSLEIYT